MLTDWQGEGRRAGTEGRRRPAERPCAGRKERSSGSLAMARGCPRWHSKWVRLEKALFRFTTVSSASGEWAHKRRRAAGLWRGFPMYKTWRAIGASGRGDHSGGLGGRNGCAGRAAMASRSSSLTWIAAQGAVRRAVNREAPFGAKASQGWGTWPAVNAPPKRKAKEDQREVAQTRTRRDG